MSDIEYESDSDKSSVVSDDENYIVDKQMKEYEKKLNGGATAGESSDDEYVNSDDEDEDDDEDDDDFGFMEGEDGENVAATVSKTKKKKTVQPEPGVNIDDEYIDYDAAGIDADDEDDETEGIEYLRKFDDSMRKNVISEHHTELFQHNLDEIEALCKTVRDKNGIIIDPFHRTLPFLTKYERARILGERAKQINAGAKPMIPIADDVIDGYLIALKELESKSIPFIIKRPLMNGGCEYWRLQDLELL